ncbi:hypothetical protein ABPG74_006626 [Tetrahymena malaccensis]
MFGKIGTFFSKVQVKADAFFQVHHSNQHQNTHAQYPPQQAQQGQYPPPPEMQAQQQGQQYPPQQQQGQYPPPPPDMQAQQCQFPPQKQGSFPAKKQSTKKQGTYPPPPPSAGQLQPQQFGMKNENPFYKDKRKSAFLKFSQKAGKDNHYNSNYFDHLEQSNYKTAIYKPEVKKITVFHNNHVVIGIEVAYSTLSNNNTTISSMGKSYQGFVWSSSIELNTGEYIQEISGRAGDSIDRLKIVTNKNQVLEVGGFGGQPFKNIIDSKHPQIVSFGGSTRDYLDSIYVIYRENH